MVHVFAERANISDSSRATVLKGFAVSEQGEIAYAVASSTLGSQFDFSLNGDDESLVGNFITVTMEGTDTILLSTASGHGIKAVFHPTHLYLETSLGSQCFNRTDGLLGNFNGNPAETVCKIHCFLPISFALATVLSSPFSLQIWTLMLVPCFAMVIDSAVSTIVKGDRILL